VVQQPKRFSERHKRTKAPNNGKPNGQRKGAIRKKRETLRSTGNHIRPRSGKRVVHHVVENLMKRCRNEGGPVPNLEKGCRGHGGHVETSGERSKTAAKCQNRR